MDRLKSNRIVTLIQREIQESKFALFWTPIVIAVVLTLIMLASVLLANRVSIMGDVVMQVLLDEENASSMNVTIHIDEMGEQTVQTYTIENSEDLAAPKDWGFSKDRMFEPKSKKDISTHISDEYESLNPMLNMLHNLLILVLILVTINYLMNSLYQDRKDRSILFWKSMPVSEWEEVLCKFGIAILVAPFIYIAVSVLIQLICVVLAMLMVSRMDMDPLELIIGHVDFVSLFFNQISGWVLSAIWMAPFYAWILLASAAAKRSPFMLAFAPVLALGFIEKFFLDSDYVTTAVGYHLPHYVEESRGVGFYLYGPDWSAISYPNLVGGVMFAALALWGAVYLRRYRFEI